MLACSLTLLDIQHGLFIAPVWSLGINPVVWLCKWHQVTLLPTFAIVGTLWPKLDFLLSTCFIYRCNYGFLIKHDKCQHAKIKKTVHNLNRQNNLLAFTINIPFKFMEFTSIWKCYKTWMEGQLILDWSFGCLLVANELFLHRCKVDSAPQCSQDNNR